MKLKNIFLFSVILLLTSCALKPITSDYTFIKTDLEKVELDNAAVLACDFPSKILAHETALFT